MDWRVMLSTFGAIFLAELGDKTQLATLASASSTTSRLSVFIGSALALVCTSAIAVLLGDAIARAIPPHVIRRAAGALFVVLGVFFLVGARAPDAPSSSESAQE